jgi:DNA-binding transcriptional LysR family regulator
MRRDHSLANTELPLDRYCEADHVVVNFSGRLQGHADKMLATTSSQHHVVLSVNQFHTAIQIVAASDLLSIVPMHLIVASRMELLLIWKPLPFALPPLRIAMLWHERDGRDLSHR